MKRQIFAASLCCGLAFWCLVASFSQSADRNRSTPSQVATPLRGTNTRLLDKAAAEKLIQEQVVVPWQQATSRRHAFSRAVVRPTVIKTQMHWAATNQDDAAVYCGVARSQRGKASESLPLVVDRTNGTILVLSNDQWVAASEWRKRFFLGQLKELSRRER